jgi:hypothetical protein
MGLDTSSNLVFEKLTYEEALKIVIHYFNEPGNESDGHTGLYILAYGVTTGLFPSNKIEGMAAIQEVLYDMCRSTIMLKITDKSGDKYFVRKY